MLLKLNFDFPTLVKPIGYEDSIMMFGSCFAEEIGTLLSYHKFDVVLNPFGIQYNPISIFSSMDRILSQQFYTEFDLFQQDGLWHSYDHHSSFSHPDKNLVLKQINESLVLAQQKIKTSKFIIITFGSSFAYQNKLNKKVVSHCHKVDQAQFNKILLQPEDIIQHGLQTINNIKKINPEVHYIFTVSPVKYIRDGIVENSLSKSILIQSTHQLIKECKNSHYFPAFEIVNDELRDHRFYKEDLVHPNALAINYIFEKFISWCLNKKSKDLFEQIIDVQKSLGHKLLFPEIDSALLFRKTQLQKCKMLKTAFPHLHFEPEIAHFSGL